MMGNLSSVSNTFSFDEMDPSRLDTLHSMEGAQDKVFDVLGCGFGPANLAIAVALAERWTEAKVIAIHSYQASQQVY